MTGLIARNVTSSGLTLKVSFQPSSLGSGGSMTPVLADPVDQLGVEQVDVDRVGVHAVMEDLPDLRAVGKRPSSRLLRDSSMNIDGWARIAVGVGMARLRTRVRVRSSPSMPLIRPNCVS